MRYSFSYLFARSCLSFSGAALGFWAAFYLKQQDVLTDPINMIYLSLVGFLLLYLLSAPLAIRFESSWQKMIQATKKIPPEAVLAAGVGVTVALIITVLLNTLLESIPGFTWYWSLLVTILLVTASSSFFVINRKLFLNMTTATEQVAFEESQPVEHKLIDTSAIIDGRISDISAANFLDGKLLIPKFVLNELQGIADSGDPLTRSKGRRGLEVLDKLISQTDLVTEVISDDIKEVHEVDEKLIRICQERKADLITTDYNLNRVAALQGVRVLNVNQLANAIKPVLLPGEKFSLNVVKQGREASQGLGYLEDGTMIVVEDGSQHVGSTIDVVVTSHLQTNMGRMIFAKPV